MSEFQDAMCANLSGNPSALAPFLANPAHAARARVYQNNMLTALGDAILDTYPAVRRIVGDEFMRALARGYVEGHPAQSPVLTGYGEVFPEFLDQFPPAQSLPYLGDVARLERAWLRALYASDQHGLRPEDLSGLGDEEIGALTPGLHPSAELAVSKWNAREIWSANRVDGEAQPTLKERQTFVLIWKQNGRVETRELSVAECVFLELIEAGQCLAAAAEQAGGDSIQFFAEILPLGVLGGANNRDDKS